MPEVTPNIRWKAIQEARAYPHNSDIAKAHYHASHAESFPNSYTKSAVEISEKFLIAFANYEDVTEYVDRIFRDIEWQQWYKF